MQAKSQANKTSGNFQRMNLVVVQSKEQFNRISYANDVAKDNNKSQTLKHDVFQSKTEGITNQDIAVPRCGKVTHKEPLLRQRPNIEHHGYFRSHQLRVPSNRSSNIFSIQYHHTQHDLEFLHSLRKQYKSRFNQSYPLTTKIFGDIIINCEHELHAKKTFTLQESALNILNQLQFKLPSKLASLTVSQRISLREIFIKIIQYWKKVKIEKYKSFPILRHLWPKTDIQQQKYPFFLPYKSRTLSKQNSASSTITKQQSSNADYRIKYLSTKNKSGRTEKQAKIGRQTRQASDFFVECKKIVEENERQRELFEVQLRNFHCLAGMYKYNVRPVWHDNITDGDNNKILSKSKGSSQLSKLSEQPYFNVPAIRLRGNNKLDPNQWRIRSQYSMGYDNLRKQVLIVCGQVNNSLERKGNNKRVKKSE